jgi:glucose-1-phosphate thymidylyltransferase
MKVILPVAGKGTRLRPHTHTRAKSLVQVAGKTVLEHIVSRLLPLDPTEVVFITDENGGQIRAVMDREFPQLNCTYLQQKEKLGPAHAISLAAGRVVSGDDLLIVFNDTIFITDVQQIASLSMDCDGLVFSKEVEDYQRFGVNIVRNGFITDMVEKPDQPVSKLAQVGLYYLRDGLDFMGSLQKCIDDGETVKGEYYLPPVFMRMIRAGKKLRAPEIDAWLDCGTPETLLSTNRYLLGGRSHTHGTVIDSVLIEPVHIGYGATVRNCILGPHVSIASECVVEQSIISDSIINTGANVQSVILSSSILGDSVTLAGASRKMNIGDNSLIDIGG